MKSTRRKKRKVSSLLIASHIISLFLGCILGMYLLPILIAPKTPSESEFLNVIDQAKFEAIFVKNIEGSDFLHWGKGQISLAKNTVAFQGKISPGPDFKLYLTRNFIDNKKEFLKVKNQSLLVGDVKSFDGFIIKTEKDLDFSQYSGVVIWCEVFSRFITSAKYK